MKILLLSLLLGLVGCTKREGNWVGIKVSIIPGTCIEGFLEAATCMFKTDKGEEVRLNMNRVERGWAYFWIPKEAVK